MSDPIARMLVFSPERPPHRQMPFYTLRDDELEHKEPPKAKVKEAALPRIQHAPPTGATPQQTRRKPIVWTRMTPSYKDAVRAFDIPQPGPNHRTTQYVRALSQALYGVDDIHLQPVLHGPDRHAVIPQTPPSAKPQFKGNRNARIIEGFCQEDDIYSQPIAHSAATHRQALVNLSSQPQEDGFLVDVLLTDERFKDVEMGAPSGLLCADGSRPYTVENRPRALAFYQNPKGLERLIVGTQNGQIHVWDVHPPTAPALTFSKQICDEQIVQVACAGDFLIAASRKGKLFQIDRYSREVVELASRRGSPILGMAFSPDRRFMVTGNNDEMIHVYQWFRKEGRYRPIAQYVGFKAGIKAIAFSQDRPEPGSLKPPKTHFLVGGGHKNPILSLWRVGKDEPLVEFDTKSQITSIHWLSQSLAATTHHDGTIRYFHVDRSERTIEELDRVQAHGGRITFATFNGKNLLTTFCPITNEISLWDIPCKAEKPVKKKPPFNPFSPSKFSIR